MPAGGSEIFVVPRDQVDVAWPEIEKHIARIEVDPRDVYADLKECRAQAWGLRSDRVLGFWLTRIENTAHHRYGLVWLCAGDLIEAGLIHMYQFHVEPWFWSEGCEWIEIHGRKGWQRLLPEYEAKTVKLVKHGKRHSGSIGQSTAG